MDQPETGGGADAPAAEAFIFVVDGETLAFQSLFLAMSLAQAHRGAAHLRSIAYVSDRTVPMLDETVRLIYEAAGVTIAPLPPPGSHWARPYPHGNKILACAAPRDVARTTFLDTDMVVTGRIGGLAPPGDTAVLAVPEGIPSWRGEGRWERAYAHIGQDLPAERVTLVRGRRLSHLPYFNAGLISFPEQPLPGAEGRFGRLWLDMASDFDRNCTVGGKRPWLDQITLPLTLYRHGLAWRALPDIYNYSLSYRDRVLRREGKAKVLHYHRLHFLRGRPVLADLTERLHEALPPRLHAPLDTALALMAGASEAA